MSETSDKPSGMGRGRFALVLEVLITALGALAIIGPEPAGVMVTRTLGVLLMLAAFLGLLALVDHPERGAGRAVIAWTATAFVAGAAIEFLPVRGLTSLGALVGLLLVAHAITASAVARRRWKARDLVAIGLMATPVLALLGGVALLAGEDVGVRGEEILVGVDVALFGLYLMIGRELWKAQSRSPSTASK